MKIISNFNYIEILKKHNLYIINDNKEDFIKVLQIVHFHKKFYIKENATGFYLKKGDYNKENYGGYYLLLSDNDVFSINASDFLKKII